MVLGKARHVDIGCYSPLATSDATDGGDGFSSPGHTGRMNPLRFSHGKDLFLGFVARNDCRRCRLLRSDSVSTGRMRGFTPVVRGRKLGSGRMQDSESKTFKHACVLVRLFAQL
jgi:hypothetical protein